MEVNLDVLSKTKSFVIYQTSDGVILCNEEIEGFAHTHLKNVNTAKWLIELSLRKKLPHDIPRYLLISLLRVNCDEWYLDKINTLLSSKKKKGVYVNKSKLR